MPFYGHRFHMYNTRKNGQTYKNMAPSKGICTCHHLHKFLCIYLVLKIYPNSGQMLGTTAEGKRENMSKSEAAHSHCDLEFFL